MKKLIGKASRQRKPKKGDVWAIPLDDGTFGFCQICDRGGYAYFDIRSKAIEPIGTVVSRPILFRVITAQDAAKIGGWTFVGNCELEKSLTDEQIFWNQPVGSNQVYLVKSGEFIPSTPAEIEGLENLACWRDFHVTERLMDHFSDRGNGIASRTNRIRVYDPNTGQEILQAKIGTI